MEATLMADRIVVVDDDEETLVFMDLVLTEEGYDVVRCNKHAAAYRVIRAMNPQLVILDLMAGPVLAGWKTFRLLGQHAPTAGIPVLLCSGSREHLRAKEDEMAAAGGDVLAKPFAIHELLGKVARLLGPAT
jgi:DNA-binding response OmpR family regulator